MRGHFFDRLKFRRAIHRTRFYGKDRLVRTEVTRKICVAPEHSPADPVNEEQRRPGPIWLDGHDRRSADRILISDDTRELLDGWRLKDGRNRKSSIEFALDLGEELNRQKRMASQFEKVAANAKLINSQHSLPNFF